MPRQPATLYILLIVVQAIAVDYAAIPPQRCAPWRAVVPSFSGFTDTVVVTDHGVHPDDTSGVGTRFQNLLDSHADPTVFLFPPGDYYFEKPIEILVNGRDNDQVIIKGAGPERTRLLFDCDIDYFKGLIWIEDKAGYGDRRRTIDLASAPAHGQRAITVVSDADEFTAGALVCVKQDNDPALMFPPADTARRWHRKWLDGQADWAAYSMGQFAVVADANGPDLTLETPLGIDFSADLHPRVSLYDNIARSVGVQDLAIEHIIDDSRYTPGGTNDVFGIVLRFARNCFVDNVHSFRTARGHVMVEYAHDVAIVNSRFVDARRYGTGGAGYGVCVQNRSSHVYIANNEFDHLRHSVVLKEGANHCVVAYNWSHDWAILDPAVVDGDGNRIDAEADMSIHGFYSHNNLFEGNLCHNIFYADYWGPTGPRTVAFRNRCMVGDTTHGIFVDDFSHHESIIGNVIGAPGRLWAHESCRDLLLEGNVVDGLTQWSQLSSESRLPPSLYLPDGTTPAFWPSGMPFPPFGPDRAWETNTLPAQQRQVAPVNTAHTRASGEKNTARATAWSGKRAYAAVRVFGLNGRVIERIDQTRRTGRRLSDGRARGVRLQATRTNGKPIERVLLCP